MLTRIARLKSSIRTILLSVLPTSKKYWIISVSLFVVLVGASFAFGSDVHALDAGEIGKSIGTWIMIQASKALLMIAKLCISLTVFALEFFIKLARYNGFIDAPIVIVGWTMVRDIANMFFVVVLLIIAFGTILGLEQYEWKKTMVNFILAAILINFSKLIAGVIIDVAHVFTMTFVNAVAATAGGNLINMFHLNKIVSIVAGGFTDNIQSDIIIEVFGGAVMALVFSVLAMFTMGAYLILMLARVVVLWALIILSPLAYILGVIPQTKSYADTWWSEFGRHVAVAPVMVFFLWLAFATLGSGNFVAGDLGISFTSEADTAKALGLSPTAVAQPKVSIAEVSTWENMANFILAIAFLWIGIEQVQKMGTRGSEFLADAKSFATKAAMIGSGYALGRWLAGEAGDKGKSLVGKAAYRMPLVGGRAWQNRGYKIGEWWGENVTQKRNDLAKKMDESYRNLNKKKLDQKYNGQGEVGYLDTEKNDTGFFSNAGAHFGRFAASLVESQGRKDKVAEDIKETYERRQKIIEESYSTSGLDAGIRKQEVTGQLKFVEMLSENKKPQKMAEIMALILKNKEAYEYYADPAMKAGEKKTQSEEQHKVEELKRLQEIREGKDGQKTLEKTAQSKAVLENLTQEINRSNEIRVSSARAEQYKKDGKFLKAEQTVQSTIQRHEREDSEEISIMNRDQRKDAGARLLDLIRNNDASPTQKLQARRDLVRLLTVSANKGYDDFQSITDEMISHLYAKEGVQNADFTDQDAGKTLLELYTGRIIDATNHTFENALEEFRKAFPDGKEGELQMQAVLASAKNALWDQGETGGFKLAPAIAAVTDAEGKRTFEISNPASRIHADDRKGNRDALAKQYVRFRDVTNLLGMTETKRNAKFDENDNITGYDVIIADLTEEQIQNLVSSHTGFSDTREASSGFHQNFSAANARGNFSDQAKKQMAKFFAAMRDDYFGRGLHDVYTKIIQTQYADLYKAITTERNNDDPNGDPKTRGIMNADIRNDVATITADFETLEQLASAYGSPSARRQGPGGGPGPGTPPPATT